MSDRLLSHDERVRFAAYCRQSAESCNEIAQQCDNSLNAIMRELAKRERAKAMAYTIVAADLESVEDMTLITRSPKL